ncbi:MAG: hypothetical protein HQM06_13040 [Magnetococcales bacterium]|nr:hypothetical protein [Magnetococcales bacterium]
MQRSAPNRRRILLVVESVAEWERLLDWSRSLIRFVEDKTLFVMLCDHHGGYESDAIPLLTHGEFLHKTEQALRARLARLLQQKGVPPMEFRLLEGAPHRVVAELSHTWAADCLLTTARTARRMQSHGGLLGLQPPEPIACPIAILPTEENRFWQGVQAFLTRFGIRSS